MNPAAEPEQPLVSIIVRSMGRALLCDAGGSGGWLPPVASTITTSIGA